MDVLKLLEDVKNDKVSLEEAAKELKQLPYEDIKLIQRYSVRALLSISMS